MMFNILTMMHRCVRFLAIRLGPRRRIFPRFFSNDLLHKYGKFFSGGIVNVSGWDDRDGEGGYYRDYFPKASSYSVTNAPGKGKGEGTARGEIPLDLTEALPADLRLAFDVVYNNTTLEHIFPLEQAFANLCGLARRAVIVVVPVIQQIHIAETYGDYWRPTTMALVRLFRKHGFEPLVVQTNDQPFQPIYCFILAVRNPGEFPEIKKDVDLEMGSYLYGSSLKRIHIDKLLKN